MNKPVLESLSVFEAVRDTCMISKTTFDWGKINCMLQDLHRVKAFLKKHRKKE